MSIDVNATYRDGAIYPETPLNLPENTQVHVQVSLKTGYDASNLSPAEGETPRLTPPQSPRIIVEEFYDIVKKYSISAPPLPEDFSRADIYSDHD